MEASVARNRAELGDGQRLRPSPIPGGRRGRSNNRLRPGTRGTARGPAGHAGRQRGERLFAGGEHGLRLTRLEEVKRGKAAFRESARFRCSPRSAEEARGGKGDEARGEETYRKAVECAWARACRSPGALAVMLDIRARRSRRSSAILATRSATVSSGAGSPMPALPDRTNVD